MDGVIYRAGVRDVLTWAEYVHWMNNPLPLGWMILVYPTPAPPREEGE